MDQVNQLKTMRDDAWSRIKSTPDYKLATSLDALITDLEAALSGEAGKSESSLSGDDEESDPTSEKKAELHAAGSNGSSGGSETESESDDDVMSELTQMIHAGLGGDDGKPETAEAEAEPADEVAAEPREDESDEEALEQDAILRAMKALDEDLSNTVGMAAESESEDSDERGKAAGRRGR